MATKKTAEVTIETGMPPPQMKEDMSVREGPPANPDDIYKELDAIAAGTAAAPVRQGPVDLSELDRPATPEDEKTLTDQGGRVDGDLITFGEKVFYADAAKRRALPYTANLSTGPRMTKLPEGGTFMSGTKSFRRVPYRTLSGSIRVDN